MKQTSNIVSTSLEKFNVSYTTTLSSENDQTVRKNDNVHFKLKGWQ